MCGLYSWKNHTMVVIPHDCDVAPNRNPPLAIPNKTFIPVSPLRTQNPRTATSRLFPIQEQWKPIHQLEINLAQIIIFKM